MLKEALLIDSIGNNITSRGCVHIAEWICKSHSLKELDLSCINIMHNLAHKSTGNKEIGDGDVKLILKCLSQKVKSIPLEKLLLEGNLS